MSSDLSGVEDLAAGEFLDEAGPVEASRREIGDAGLQPCQTSRMLISMLLGGRCWVEAQ